MRISQVPKPSKQLYLPIALALSCVLLVGFVITIRAGQYLQDLENKSKESQKYISLLRYFGGYESSQKTLLVLANNAELRFGGGFIGSVGVVSAKDGKVSTQPIESVYSVDLDKNNIASKYTPPPYMATLTKTLGLRDSNTELNWPDDAQKALYYYKLNTGQTVDNVVQITPNVLDVLLQKLGPVYLKDYELTVTHENFRDSVQLEVEAGKDKQQKIDPKSGVLGQLANTLFDRLLQKDVSQLQTYLPMLEQLIAEKQVLVYSTNKPVQQNIVKLGASGALQQTDDNYFMYSEANIAANKDSPYIKNVVDMSQTIEQDGSSTVETKVSSTLDTDYRHQYLDPNINKMLWLVGNDISYVKLVLPNNSKILSVTSMKDGRQIDLEQVESESSEGKNIFGYLRRLTPHQTQSTTIRYTVPTHYVLDKNMVINSVIQKQPGGWPYALYYTLRVPEGYNLRASSVAPISAPIGADNAVMYTGTVQTDTIMSYIYAKK